LRNFGFNGPEDFADVGINGKNSEFHAAMGLANMKYLDDIFRDRKELCGYYDESLKGLEHAKPLVADDCDCNYAYYPIILESEEVLKKHTSALNANWIYPRRYFHPSLNTISIIADKVSMPVSEDISKRVLCLPLYYGLSKEEIDFICRILLRSQHAGEFS